MRPHITFLLAAVLLTASCSGEKKEAAADTKQKSRTVSVQTVKATPETLTITRSFLVSLEADEETRIVSKAAGYVTQMLRDRGDCVAAGDKLALVEPEELRDAADSSAAQIEAAKVSLENLKKKLERTGKLFDEKYATQEEFDSARAAVDSAEANLKAAEVAGRLAGRRTGYAEITAPFAGCIIERLIDTGSYVSPSSGGLFTLGTVDTLKARAGVAQQDLAFFPAGKSVKLAVDGIEHEFFTGTVSRFSPSLDTATRTLDVEITFPNPKRRLKPGMFGRITVEFTAKEPRIVLDPRAILRDGTKESVFGVEKGTVVSYSVTLGRLLPDGRSEILSGIAPGVEIIVVGRDLVRPGMTVTTVPMTGNSFDAD